MLLLFVAAAAGFAAAAFASLFPVDSSSGRRLAALTLSLGAGAGAALCLGAPTGTGPVDLAYRAILGFTLTLLGARTKPWLLAGATALTLLRSWPELPATLFAVGAAGAIVATLATYSPSRRARTTLAGATAAAALSLALASPAANRPFGAQHLLGVGAAALVALPGLQRSPRKVRRQVRRLALAGVLVIVGSAAAGLLAATQARPPLERGLQSAQAGLRAAQDGVAGEPGPDLRRAASEFGRGERTLRSPLALAGRLAPLVSQQLEALTAMASAGGGLAGAGADLAEALDGDALQVKAGVVPIAALQAARPLAMNAASAMAQADAEVGRVDRRGLIPPVRTRLDDLRARITDGRNRAQLVLPLLDVLPGLLGDPAPRRYFVAVQSPSELRGSGGFIGSFAEITAEQGTLAVARVGRTSELNQGGVPSKRQLDLPPELLARYGRFDLATTWQSATISPHFPSDALLITQLYPQSGGREVDGVIAIDPFAIQALLGVVGPVTVPEWPTPLDGKNAAQILLFDQYRVFPDNEQDDRRDFLASVTGALVQKLTTQPVEPAALVRAMGTAAMEKRIMVWSPNPDEQALFQRFDLDGAMHTGDGDFLAVIAQNASANKIDWFLRKSIDYQATLDPKTGQMTAIARIELKNEAPASGLPRYILGNSIGRPRGTSRLYVSVHSALFLDGATIDGKPALMESEIEQARPVYSTYLEIGPGGTTVLELKLAGQVPADGTYRLAVHRQPTAAPDALRYTIDVPDGWRIERDAALSGSLPLQADLAISAALTPG